MFHVNQSIMLQVGVKSLIVNPKGEFLLIKRDPLKYPEANNLWDIPGGRIDLGVSLADNLKREIKEETGLKAKTLVILTAQDILKSEKHIVRLTYLSRVTSTKVTLSEEHTEYQWVKMSDILKTKGLDKYTTAIIKDKELVSFIKDTLKRYK